MRFDCNEVFLKKSTREKISTGFGAAFIAAALEFGGMGLLANAKLTLAAKLALAIPSMLLLAGVMVAAIVAVGGLFWLIGKGRQLAFPAYQFKEVYAWFPVKAAAFVWDDEYQTNRYKKVCVWRENVLKERCHYGSRIESHYKVLEYDKMADEELDKIRAQVSAQ
jgi:hypothetical protein